MDDDYDDFFRQDISEGKDEDEDKDIPSVSLSFSTLQSFMQNMVYSRFKTFWYSRKKYICFNPAVGVECI